MEEKKEKKDLLQQRSEYVFNFALENWYKIEEMQKFTARSEFIHLNKHQIEAIHNLTLENHKKLPMTEENQKIIDQLEKEIDELIQKKFDGKAFVKLSTRSPKGWPFPNFQGLYFIFAF